jgi:hypothetical protein
MNVLSVLRLAAPIMTALVLLGGAPQGVHGQQVGILIVPFADSASQKHGRAGDLVRFRFRDTPRSSTSWDIEFEGVLYRDVWDGRLIPFDSSFAPMYVFSVLNSQEEMYTDSVRERIYDRADLATRARQLFAYHPYRDHFAAFECHAVMRKEEHETEGKQGWPLTVACIEAYLRELPNGLHRDELEWLGVRMRHATYEYEGAAEGPIGQAQVFEAYLKGRPTHAMRDAIELHVATLWSLAYEMIMTADDPPSSSRKAEADRYRARADSMYARLSARPDPDLAAKAVVARFNLRNGRRIYADPNAW